MVAQMECGGGPDPTAIACPILVTERLVLRPPHADDAADMARLANNRRVSAMLARVPHPYGEAHAQAFIDGAATRGEGCAYAVTLAETGAFIGCAGLDRTATGAEEGLALGYWIGEPFWGYGLATEAAHALVDHAFRATPADVLHASCRVLNTASRRVIHKCGFQYSGQGMMDSAAAGRVAIERYRLDRRTWISLRSWPQA